MICNNFQCQAMSTLNRKAVIFSMIVMIFGVIIDGFSAKRFRRVVGGHYVDPAEFPHYVVRLKIYNNEGTELRCGGTIINPRHILTAGHCLFGRENLTVHSGTHETNDVFGVQSNYSRLICHPAFNGTIHSKMTVENDIGIVVLDGDLNLTNGRHAKLILTTEPPPEDGTIVRIFGWGLVSDVGFDKPKYLKTANLVMATSQCDFSSSQAFCTNTSEVTSCGGDSGSPIVYNRKLIGIHSTDSCRGGEVARHISVYHYRDWINSIMNQEHLLV